MSAHVKICTCCGVGYTHSRWERLPFVGAWVPDGGKPGLREVHEVRNCTECDSTIHLVLVEHDQAAVGGAGLDALVGLVARLQREIRELKDRGARTRGKEGASDGY